MKNNIKIHFIGISGIGMSGIAELMQDIKKLDTKKILVQGYMFPLDHEEKQKTFLLTPFPQSCPYYPHVSSNLIIEVHAKDPISFSYDAVDIEGILELVPNDDLYNVFFRLKIPPPIRYALTFFFHLNTLLHAKL